MESTYRIRPSTLDEKFSIELTTSEFEELRAAHAFLLEYMHFEECFMQMIMCLEDFEIFILKSSQTDILLPYTSYDFFQDQRVRANTKVLSFLNSMTSFRDQAPRIHKFVSGGTFKRRFWKLWDEELSSSLSFKFCDYFRNYSQHETQPVDSVSVGGRWDEKRELAEHRTTVYVNLDKVLQSQAISRSQAKEFSDHLRGQIDLSVIIRESSGCVGKVVKKCREDLDADFEKSIEVYECWLRKISGHGSEIITSVVEKRSEEGYKESFSLFHNFIARAKRLRSNPILTNNHKHFISNRPRGHKD